jgi:hypothetical protein
VYLGRTACKDASGLEGLLMTDRTNLAFVLRSVRVGALVCIACLTLALSASLVLAQGTEVKLYNELDTTGYVGVELYYVPISTGPFAGAFQYTYKVTNHSGLSGYKLDRFLYTCLGVSDPNTAFLPAGDPIWITEPKWGYWYAQFFYGEPKVTTLVENGVPAVELMWKAADDAPFVYSDAVVGHNPAWVHSASFGFTSPFAISGADPLDLGTAYVGGAYSNGKDLLYGPYDPNGSPGGGQVPEWSPIMLGLIGFGGMGWRFRRRRE